MFLFRCANVGLHRWQVGRQPPPLWSESIYFNWGCRRSEEWKKRQQTKILNSTMAIHSHVSKVSSQCILITWGPSDTGGGANSAHIYKPITDSDSFQNRNTTFKACQNSLNKDIFVGQIITCLVRQNRSLEQYFSGSSGFCPSVLCQGWPKPSGFYTAPPDNH